MERDTAGKISLDLFDKKFEDKHSAHEQMREQLKDYEKNIEDTLKAGKKIYEGDFFLVVLTKKERIMTNVIRNYYFHRESCPTPDWDQVVYHYKRRDNELEFKWVIPSKDTCEMIRSNPLSVSESERELRDYVLSLYDGSLLHMARVFNGEELPPKIIAG